MAVLQNRPFLLIWLAQLATQVGGNMVLYGLTIVISAKYSSNIAVSALMLCFLVPAVIFSAVAGVYVDQMDRRLVLVVTNVLRGLAFLGVAFAGDNLLLMYPLVFIVSTITTFFGPAEASMIPILVPRNQLLSANGIYTLTTNAAFAAGFALFGPFVLSLATPAILIVVVAALYFIAAALCWTLPPAPPVEAAPVTPGSAVADAERAVAALIDQLAEGIDYIRKNRTVGWSLTYLGVSASLIGVLGTLGPKFARTTLGLGDKDFVVIVLPLGLGIVTGIMALNSYGKYLPRRRLIEGGLIALGLLVVGLSLAGPFSRFLEGNVANRVQDLGRIVSILGIVITIGFLAGVAYIFVAVPAQTQLQEDIAEEVRGRIFGILNMLVSIASFLPIIIVAPIADLFGNPPVIFVVGVLIALSGILSVVARGALIPTELPSVGVPVPAPVDPLMAVLGGKDLAPVHVPPRHSGEMSDALNEASPESQHAGAPKGEPVAVGRTEPVAIVSDDANDPPATEDDGTPGGEGPEDDGPTDDWGGGGPPDDDGGPNDDDGPNGGGDRPTGVGGASGGPAASAGLRETAAGPESIAPDAPDQSIAPESPNQSLGPESPDAVVDRTVEAGAAGLPIAPPDVRLPETPVPFRGRDRRARRPRGVIRALGMAEPIDERRSVGERLRDAGNAVRRNLPFGREDAP